MAVAHTAFHSPLGINFFLKNNKIIQTMVWHQKKLNTVMLNESNLLMESSRKDCLSEENYPQRHVFCINWPPSDSTEWLQCEASHHPDAVNKMHACSLEDVLCKPIGHRTASTLFSEQKLRTQAAKTAPFPSLLESLGMHRLISGTMHEQFLVS